MTNNDSPEKIKRSEIVEAIKDSAPCPVFDESEIGETEYKKIPLSRLAAAGTGFMPMVTAVQNVLGGAGKSGLYFVDTGGKTMFNFRGSTKFLGSLKDATGAVGGGQARLTALPCDPTMLFMAVALANIDKKLDAIKELQQEMMNFLIQKEKADLKGNLVFLFDTLENYKHNWNSELFKNSNYTKVLDIRQESEKKIAFYREQIVSKVNKKSFIHIDRTVNKQLEDVEDLFKDYQFSLYALAFSSFLEIMLLENYEKDYLDGVTKKIKKSANDYSDLYQKSYESITGYASTSVQSTLLKGLSKTSSAAGKTIEKIPGISNTQADETLIALGDKIKKLGDKKTKNQMKALDNREDSYVKPFIENIKSINELYNSPLQLAFDTDYLYIVSAS